LHNCFSNNTHELGCFSVLLLFSQPAELHRD
jgi:hypothetical protein